ncbi:hypothetical protein ACFFJX_09275 [Pseudarcicella hirudinis]|uniref:hypothetical protein n=1 Tax=Pseudarcicella hirudinis TaxID=1079859 RepID=UPI0035E7BE31
MARLAVIGKQGFDDLGNKIANEVEKPIGKLQKLQKVAELYANMSLTSNNPEIISKYNLKLQQTQAEIQRVNNVGKVGFDALGNAIEKNQNVVGKLWSGLYKVANILPGIGVAGLLAFGLEPLINFISKLDILKEKLSETEKFNKALSDSLSEGSEYSQAVKNVSSLRINLELAKTGLYDKKAVVEEYNKSIGAVAGQVKNLAEVEKGLANNADEYIKMTLYKAAANKALEEAATKALLAEKENLKKPEETVGIGNKILNALTAGDYKNQELYKKAYEETAKKNRENAVEALEKERKNLEQVAKSLQDKAAAEAAKMGGVLGKNLTKETKNDSYVKAAESLQRQVYEIEQEYSRKRLSKDDEQLQALRDRFQKISTEVEKFNKNPQNKIKVDGSGLDATKESAISDLKYRQDTEKLKISLEQQKNIYSNYETFKKDFGDQAANERFSKELNINKSYLQIVQQEYEKLSGKQAETLTGGEKERLEYLTKTLQTATNEKQKADDDIYKNAIESAKTYADRLIQIDREYQQKRKSLSDKGALTSERLEVLNEEKQKAIESAKDEALQKTAIYKKLAIDTVELTRIQAKAQIEVIRELLKQGSGLPTELAKKLEAELSGLEVKLKVGVEQSNLDELKSRYRDLILEIGQTDQFGQSIVSESERKRIVKALLEIKKQG